VTKFAAARFGAAVPDGGAYGPDEAAVMAELQRRLPVYEDALEAIELRKAAQELRAIWARGNEYLQEAAPWSAIKTDPERAAAITRFAFNLIRLYAALSRPFLPDAADRMLAALRLADAGWPATVAEALGALRGGEPFDVPAVLFAKLDDARRVELEARFAGA
jgi:methionyl-tRNA synthetase